MQKMLGLPGFPDSDDGESTAAADVPERKDTAEADRWDLRQLYPETSDWLRAFEALEGRFADIDRFRGKVGESAAALRDCLEFEKGLDLEIERLHHYAMLQMSENGADAGALERAGRLKSLLTRIGEACSFTAPEIQAIPDGTFAGYLADPVLVEWVASLGKLRRFKPHTLSGSEERILALGGAALHGYNDTFSQLTNVDMKFGKVEDADGNRRELTQSTFASFLNNRERRVRKDAFHGFYAEIKDHAYTLASCLGSSIKADVFRARARAYPSALKAALFADKAPVSVYEHLIASVRSRADVLHHYYDLRRRLLGLDDVHHYDTYVPLVGEVETHYTYEKAAALVVDALRPLGDGYTSTLREGMLEGRWVDRYESKGKRSGAFSSSSYGNPPFILMNYKADVFSDVYTLAHEAGHSMHTWFSQREQSFQDYHYPILLAEVASTVNEQLLTHHLLEITDDPKMRAYVINRQIDDLRSTLCRQTMFAEFEMRTHALEEAGEALTLDSFKAVYRELLDVYFGERFTIDAELELECLRIPHFYSAFYVYKYATGISAAVALGEGIIAGGEAEVGKYLAFLKAGGSQYPLDTLRRAGVDLEERDPVERALDLLERRIGELEGILEVA